MILNVIDIFENKNKVAVGQSRRVITVTNLRE